MKKNSKIIFPPYISNVGPDESLRPPAPTPIKMDEYQDDILMEQHVPHPPLVPHAPHAPRPPTGQSQPRRRNHHRIVRPNQAVEVPKIDLSFKSPESDEDSDPTDLNKPQAHASDMHADSNNAHAYNAVMLNTNQMGAFHADRSRTFGMTYLEKAYGRSGFHLPDIKDNQEPVGRNIIKVKSKKPSLINLDLTENNGSQPAADIKLPAMISHSVKPTQAKTSDIEQHRAPGQPVTIDNRRKAAVVELPAIEQKDALAHKVPVPPKQVKPTALEHLPALAQHRALAHKVFASKQTIASAFEQLPTLTQQATMTRDLLSPRQPKATGADQAAAWSPQSLSPKQASAVEYIPSLVAKSPARLSPHGQELQRRQQLSPRAPPISVASTYGEMSSYGPNAPLPRYKAFPPSKPTIHFTKNSNAVPSDEPKPVNANVESDGTLLIGLEEVHLSPDELDSNPSPKPTPPASPKVPPDDDQESSSVTPPKVLSITDQVKAFKARQDNNDLRDLRSETSLEAAKAELTDVSTDPLKEEEKRKLKDQILYKDMIPSKPKPPHHLGTHFVTGPFNIKLAPGEHINVHPGAAKLPPSGLRKRRQPRLRKDNDT